MGSVFEEIREEALTEGRTEGMRAGMSAGLREAARQMLRMGDFSVDVIARITSLDVDEVQRLGAEAQSSPNRTPTR